MPATRIDVRIGVSGVPVGELIYDVSGTKETSVFSYHPSFLEHRNRFAISPDMPLSTAPIYTCLLYTSPSPRD